MYSPTPSIPHVSSNYIYDTVLDKWRPILDSDFGGGGGGKDAFGRLRISNPEMIFNSKQLFDNQPLYWDDIQESGSGTTSTHSVDTASSTLSVSATTAGKRTRQTFMRFNYQASKSQLIFITGILKASGGGTGIITRMGYFDDDNGLFLECNGGTINLVRRSRATGSIQDDTIPQSSWNLDKMDGTGVSGITLDFTKTQIFMIDFEWLGVGRVRFGFNVNGTSYYVHELSAANTMTTVYMSSPNLPLRYQIINSGTGIASSINCICSAVISEGGREEVATNSFISTGSTSVSANNGQLNPIIALRLKTGYKSCTIDVLDISMLVTSQDNYEWNLVLNPTTSSALSYSDLNNSAIQKAIGASGISATGGFIVAGGYGNTKSEIAGDQFKSLLKLGASITGRMDTLVLCARPLGNSPAVTYAALNFREFN